MTVAGRFPDFENSIGCASLIAASISFRAAGQKIDPVYPRLARARPKVRQDLRQGPLVKNPVWA